MRAYLDHAATTPMRASAIEALTAEAARTGNASSLHASGRRARRVVEEARERIAARIGARPSEIVFTSGGTESDNLALKGAFWARPDALRVISTTIEHHAILDSLEWLSTQGAKIELLACDAKGRVSAEALAEALQSGEPTCLVSVMWANNEMGAIQPVAELAEVARSRGVWSHSDAVQAVGHLPVDFAASGLDSLSFTAHKLGGPVGIGALVVRRELDWVPVQHGGGQERDLRSGTLAVPLIAAFAAAVEEATDELETESRRVQALRRHVLDGVLNSIEGTSINGPAEETEVLPGIVNLCFAGCEADALLMLLDQAGVDCSTGSACTAGVAQPSHVLIAMGHSAGEAGQALRFSLGHTSSSLDVEALLAALPEAVRRARSVGSSVR